MIIDGERRFRACRMGGLAEVPVRVIEADDSTVAELALLENLQREDLNLIEEARAYQTLMDLGLSMEEVARKIGFTSRLGGCASGWISCGCIPPTSATWWTAASPPARPTK